ncbi:hypothetical protein H8E65_05930 [Candidatus Bathyarchaeota archaeon]|nr:hypothetical protein [Candidatus Bathyarchaeota archaeon]MBL7167342.1 hypothetical protein [Candidatus Bathyarchaeota archaeon]
MSARECSNGREDPVKALLLLILLSALASSLLFSIPSYSQSFVTGTVVDEDGVAVEGAKVSLWFGRKHFTSALTDAEGFFELEYEAVTGYNVSVYADDPSTPGVDYLPVWVQFADLLEPGAVITLRPGASLLLEGDVQFVFSNSIPENLLYAVLEPDSGGLMMQYGVPILYGSHERGQSYFLDLESSHLIVPAGKPFILEVNSSILVVRMEVYSFEVDEHRSRTLGKGELASLDVRSYSIGFNLEIVSTLMDEVKARIDYMVEKGFYMVKERSTTATAEGAFSDAQSLLSAGRYVESFGFSKMSYIDLAQVRARIINMQADATSSVYIIVVFLALTSTTIAFLLTNSDPTKILGSAAVYACFLAVLYVAYPGSALVPFMGFLQAGVLSLIGSLFLAILLPRWMKGASRRGMVPLRNILVPIFSMAKRSIRRRRLRFLLTLISITVLVMSFVTLTSFSETHDLLVRRISAAPTPVNGVLLRTAGYSFETPAFLPEGGVSLEWLIRQPEVALASQKVENLPSIRPVTTLNGVRIYGVVGFDSDLEDNVLGLSSVLEEGQLPSEGGVVISEDLRDTLDVDVGETLLLGGMELVLEGVFDDASIWALRDLDGSSYLPGKEENINPPEEQPMYQIVRCETDEIVLLDLTTAMNLPLVRVSRIDVSVNEGVDVGVLAERLALERGYWAWSASEAGVHVALMGSYLEGKGLPLIVPWTIVVLNVVVTMLNSMYERRKEIHILSSVGLNPSQIGTIFVAEASIIGLTGGGIGYLMGMVLYKGMSLFGVALEVEQKVSAFWSLASIGIAMTAVVMGAVASLRSSTVITPSLQRRWRISGEKEGVFRPWEIAMPVRLLPEQVPYFKEYVLGELRALETDMTKKTSMIKVYEDGKALNISFVYSSASPTVGELYTRNTLIITENGEKEVEVKMSSLGERQWSHEVGSMVRMIIMRWSTSQTRVIGSGKD